MGGGFLSLTNTKPASGMPAGFQATSQELVELNGIEPSTS